MTKEAKPLLRSRIERLAKLKRLSTVFKQEVAAPSKPETAVIYLGHLPPGFEEDGLRQFFKQFGTVSRVQVSRSRKTGRSRGYGFVEFQDREVAQIAAETMHGFILFNKQLVCKLLTPAQVHPMLFSGACKPFNPYPRHVDFKKRYNDTQEKEVIKARVEKLLETEKGLREKLKGIGYEFPGFQACVEKGVGK